MEVIGKVHHVGDELQVTASYTKRELVVQTDEQYPQLILIEFGQGKCNEYLDKLALNDEVKVSINLRGREWVNPQGETKWFNSIQGWRIEKQEQTFKTPASPVASPQTFAPAPVSNEPDESDVPF